MDRPTIHLEPVWVLPPNRVGYAPQPSGAPVLAEIPRPEAPAEYPRTIAPQPQADKAGQDYIWHGGPGIVINTYA